MRLNFQQGKISFIYIPNPSNLFIRLLKFIFFCLFVCLLCYPQHLLSIHNNIYRIVCNFIVLFICDIYHTYNIIQYIYFFSGKDTKRHSLMRIEFNFLFSSIFSFFFLSLFSFLFHFYFLFY